MRTFINICGLLCQVVGIVTIVRFVLLKGPVSLKWRRSTKKPRNDNATSMSEEE